MELMWKGLIHQYKEFLPVTDQTPALTLHEGNTPLIHLPKLSEQLGIELHVKTEGVNPTGSFKDRGMVMAVAKAKEEGNDTIMCASTGNTSAAAAAYAARANMKCIVIIPNGKIAFGKLAQAVMYGKPRLSQLTETLTMRLKLSVPSVRNHRLPLSTQSTLTALKAKKLLPSKCANSWGKRLMF